MSRGNGEVGVPSALEVGKTYESFVRPRVAQMLRAVRMDVKYHSAGGDYIYYRNEQGEEVCVLDLLGGFGATLLGHNNPVLLAHAQAVLAAKPPFHAQASIRGGAARLAERLSELVGRTTGQQYVTTFASSGAEAVEAALKHAGAEYNARLETSVRQIREGILRTQRTLATAPPHHLEELLASAASTLATPVHSADALFAHLQAQCERLSAAAPVVWALDRGFHGKTTGALRLTHNPKFRALWSFLGCALFLDPTDDTAIARASRDAKMPYFVLETSLDGAISLQQRSLSRVMACFVEPIRGEGGIWELEPRFASRLRAAADELGFPLVFDEIQSGMGRTGTLLASEKLQVNGDYYLFSKSLGGGIAKISAMMVDRSRYVDDFGYLHTSTFAEDDWSCEVALSVLELLEQDDGRFYRICAEKGDYFRSRLEAIAAKYPRTVRQVRGRGLMLGLDLETNRPWKSRLIRVLLEQDLLGFMIAGYLLHEKQIRIAPALSANSTLRLEPSLYISYDEMDRATAALEHVVAQLDADDAHQFARFLVLAAPQQDTTAANVNPPSDLGFVPAAQ